jgi:hypothetical protein
MVFAATTAIDLATSAGEEATIEDGRPGPVLRAAGTRIAPEGSQARNPAQDLTPAALVAALVTEEGVLRAPYEPAIAAAVERAAVRRAASPGFAALRHGPDAPGTAGAQATTGAPATAEAPAAAGAEPVPALPTEAPS